jgi:hypothetical protein
MNSRKFKKKIKTKHIEKFNNLNMELSLFILLNREYLKDLNIEKKSLSFYGKTIKFQRPEKLKLDE